MKKDQYNVAIVGATGAVGVALREILAQRQFPVGELYLLASERSAGETVKFGDRTLVVEALSSFDFAKADIGLFSAGGALSREYAPKAAAAGCVVIDNTSEFRYDEDIPLVVPEVNPEAIANFSNRNIIANPNCSTIQMVVALKPIADRVGIERINVCTYQAVSGSGKEAIEELQQQSQQVLAGEDPSANVYPHPIAFNVLPHIDVFQTNGYTKEEMKMVWETRKIMGDANILVNPTAVRVPVYYGHSEAVHLETKGKFELSEVRQWLAQAPGVTVLDAPEDNQYATPAQQAAGSDSVYVSRIRRDISHEKGLNLWVVSDNVRKGAALNSVQIAELLIQDYL
ncbi:MAG: aspartate-semialdehyde dehydrogenase [Gammaproteobacteria bacterium]|nr:aspartate-semialdehyde dehydrogenase [Gammaproteobacteria bacterium]NVK87794.1 aspartate-semialdehyde dehydrogenase [Gammaproteobacteria bacterium]